MSCIPYQYVGVFWTQCVVYQYMGHWPHCLPWLIETLRATTQSTIVLHNITTLSDASKEQAGMYCMVSGQPSGYLEQDTHKLQYSTTLYFCLFFCQYKCFVGVGIVLTKILARRYCGLQKAGIVRHALNLFFYYCMKNPRRKKTTSVMQRLYSNTLFFCP